MATATTVPETREEKTRLLRGFFHDTPRVTLAFVGSLGYLNRPTITADMSHEEQIDAEREARFQTEHYLETRGYPGEARARCTSLHDHVYAATAIEILLDDIVPNDSIWERAQRKIADRQEREAAEAREKSRLRNHVEGMLDVHYRNQRATWHRELSTAIGALIDGDAEQLPIVADLATRLGLSPTSIKNMVRDAEEQRGL